MIKRVQWKFALTAMAAMCVCVAGLVAVINILYFVQIDRQMERALEEMTAVVEAFTQIEQQAAEETPQWQVESYVEEVTPEESPAAQDLPEELPVEADTDTEQLPPKQDTEIRRDDLPRFFGTWGDFPNKHNNFPAEQAPQETPAATPEPETPSVLNHYYYYYQQQPNRELDLRNTALNQYAGRFFIVTFLENGDSVVDMSDNSALTEENAILLAERMRGETGGYLNDYRFVTKESDGLVRVYFLDCSTDMESRRSLLAISCAVGLGGLLLSFVFIYFMSRKAIWPLKESMERQKRFITDAGHELKTPLSVIGTNMDILTMDLGDNEWVEGTKKQLRRLRKLVANLISLSKLEEGDNTLELQEFSLSDTAMECVDSFAGVAEMEGKTLRAEIQPGLTVRGDVLTIGQMLSILCDNAIKYSEGDTVIDVRLRASGKKVVFETENDWSRSVEAGELNRLFDRFYRGDPSRSKTDGKNGYGLGLSIAKAIAEKNHVQLTVHENDRQRIVFRAVFKGGSL